MSKENTGKQGGAPALPNNFSGKKPEDCSAPKIGNGPGLPISPNSENRGKDGTSS